jgi:HAE1 family hydrophobic/amphiphilic exporter-1
MATEFTRDDIRDLEIRVTNSEGKTEKIKLSEIATFEAGESLPAINRISQTRYMTVTASVADGYNIGLLGNDIQKKLDAMDVPAGYHVKLQGENEMIDEAMIEMMKMLALAIVFIYLVMVAQFQSLKSPFIVMFTSPLAFTGGFMALWMGGMEVSVIAMIGFVMLSGIIVNNGIVLVDYVNQLREGGMDKEEALAEAGRTRLRPIVMTALTTILGLAPLALGIGMGADMAQPMAVVTIGGLIYGTILTLWVVPCVYDILNPDKKNRRAERAAQEEV